MGEYIRSRSGVYYLRLYETCHRRTKSRSLKNSGDNPDKGGGTVRAKL